jgi:hypothetical protein
MSFTGFTFEKEGFYDFNPNPVTKADIDNNIQALKQKSENLNNTDVKIISNFADIEKNVSDYNTLRIDMKIPDIYSYYTPSKYNTITIPDKTDMIQTTYDVRKEDINTMLLQQNYIYILGSVTCATLLISAIMIGRSRE